MNILGIETSCDETAVAVIEVDTNDVSVLSNIVSSQIKTHAPFGGVVPMLAARDHAENIGHVFDKALKEANIKNPAEEIDLIAVTRGPGLGPALLVGLTFARTLAMRWNKQIVGINHMDGHIHSNWLPPVSEIRNSPSPLSVGLVKFEIRKIPFPALNLLVSGGHTELVLMKGHGKYERIGETLDDAVGEAFDKVARLLGLGYPGGPALSKLAESGNNSAYNLPRPLTKTKNFNFSYSGLKTAVLYLIHDLTDKKRDLTDKERSDIAASFQEAAIDVLIQKTRNATKNYQPKTILISGGVSANTLLRKRMKALGSELTLSVFAPDLIWTGDNAAMIALAGYFSKEKATSFNDVAMDANLRIGDKVEDGL